MRSVTEILSKPVISLYEGKTEGTIKNVIFSKELKALKWLVLFDDKEMLEQKYLYAKDIFNIGENAVVVKNGECIVPNIIDDEPLQHNPINCAVYTVNGNVVDTVIDAVLDDKHNTIYLELKNGTQISPEKIVITGQDALILQDENNPININSLKQKNFPKPLKNKTTMQKVEIMSVEEIKNDPEQIEKIEQPEEVLPLTKIEKIEEVNEPVVLEKTTEIKQQPEVKSEQIEKVKRPYNKKQTNTTAPKVTKPKAVVKKELVQIKENAVQEVINKEQPILKPEKNKINPEVKKEVNIKKEKLIKVIEPIAEVEPIKETEMELQKTEQELEQAKQELKQKHETLKKEVNILKKSIQKIIKPKTTTPKIIKPEKAIKKIVSPPFNENNAKPNKIYTSPTFLLGRIATKMVQTYQGEIIIKMGEKITNSQIELAFVSGKISELIRYSK